MIWTTGRTYLDRTSYKYRLISKNDVSLVFEVGKADGTICLAARYLDGSYVKGSIHDYDIVKEEKSDVEKLINNKNEEKALDKEREDAKRYKSMMWGDDM